MKKFLEFLHEYMHIVHTYKAKMHMALAMLYESKEEDYNDDND